MRDLIVHEDPQLRRIERTIAEIEARPPAAQRTMQVLLRALERERNALLHASARATRPRRTAA
jgi:uncharacterized protein YdhG (YjbR/CyaY superfamily)